MIACFRAWLRIRMRSAYDAGTHKPNSGVNGGCANYRLVKNADWSTSAVGLLYVKGWIWNKGFILTIKVDPVTVTSGTRIDTVIICAEGQAVDAAANTMLLLCPCWGEEETEYGMKSVDATAIDNGAETHFIHCLGDANALLPFTVGFGVSGLSNKLRTMPLYAWRYRADGTKAVLIYQTSFTWAYRDIIWGGDEFTYGAGSDPDGGVSIDFSAPTNSHALNSRTHVDIFTELTNVHVVTSRTNERLLDRDHVHDQCYHLDDPYGVLTQMPFKIEGVTKNSAGVALGGCTVVLLKANADGMISGKAIMQTKISDGSGNYKFYVRDPDTEYFVVAFKSGAPNVFGRTDKTIKGVAV